MIVNADRYRYKGRKKRKKGWLLLFILLVSLVGAGLFWWFSGDRSSPRLDPQATSLGRLWENRLFDEIIKRCAELLDVNPMDADALMYSGFSYFYKAIAELTLEDKISYLEQSIVQLRRAKVSAGKKWTAETDYVLGKAYYHKGKYYFDLTIQYLEQALAAGYEGLDIYDYLGLAYTQTGELEEGLAYFHRALEINTTDILLLTIAQSYYQLKDGRAEEYLIRAVNKTADFSIEKKSRFLLGQLYFDRSDYFKAEKEYLHILDLDQKSANAHFYLGEIYAKMKDTVRARAEWRKTLILDPNHYGAKLRYYK